MNRPLTGLNASVLVLPAYIPKIPFNLSDSCLPPPPPPNFGRSGARLVNMLPISVQIARFGPELGQLWPMWSQFRQLLASFGSSLGCRSNFSSMFAQHFGTSGALAASPGSPWVTFGSPWRATLLQLSSGGGIRGTLTRGRATRARAGGESVRVRRAAAGAPSPGLGVQLTLQLPANAPRTRTCPSYLPRSPKARQEGVAGAALRSHPRSRKTRPAFRLCGSRSPWSALTAWGGRSP